MKKIVSTIALLVMVVLLCSCGDTKNGQNEQAEQHENSQNKIEEVSESLKIQRLYYPYIEECVDAAKDELKNKSSFSPYGIIFKVYVENDDITSGKIDGYYFTYLSFSATNSYGGAVDTEMCVGYNGLFDDFSITSDDDEYTKTKRNHLKPDGVDLVATDYEGITYAKAATWYVFEVNLDDYVSQGYEL